MLPRRAFLKMLPAAGFGAKSVTAEAALALASLAGDVATTTTTDCTDPVCDAGARDPWHNHWDLIDRIDKNRQESMRGLRSLPESIRSKKSWSPAFKVLTHTQQEREINTLQKAMQNNEGLAKKVWQMLEGKV